MSVDTANVLSYFALMAKRDKVPGHVKKTERVVITATKEERLAWFAAAGADRRSLSAWAALLLNRATAPARG